MRLRTLGQVRPIFQHDIGTERAQLRGHIIAAHDIDGMRTARLRQHDQMAPDRGIGDVLDHPVPRRQRDMILQQQECRCRIDAQHRRLCQIQACRDRDRVLAADTAALHPVLALHVEDEIAGSHLGHASAQGGDSANAFGAGGRRERRPQPIAAAAE